ncbi:MAG: hypothetical protein SGI77_24560 [Pirellulaceae bacterium]|nr:hypothetical protein [Pirellulaceae bacterium]
MKALDKERSRRYETATRFASDIDRYLTDQPVLACPPSAAYRIKKFIKKHRGPVTAASNILLLLVAGLLGTFWGWQEARKQAIFARAAQVEAEQQTELALEAEKTASAARDREAKQRQSAE